MKIKNLIFNIKFETKYLVNKVIHTLKRDEKLRCKYCNSTKIRFFNPIDVMENNKPRRYTEGICHKCGACVRIREIWESREEQDKILKERENIKNKLREELKL